MELTTSDGYDLLSSQKKSSLVTVSLRSATDEYAQFYVSIFKTSGEEVFVSPTRVAVVSKGAQGRKYNAYAPSEAPKSVMDDARGDVRFLADLMDTTGKIYAQKSDVSAYEAGAPKGESAQLLLQPASMNAGDRLAGYVYTPFSKEVNQFVIKIPVGKEVHRFQYLVESE